MLRRTFIAGLSAATLPLNLRAQSALPRVGVLVSLSASHPFTEVFRSGMRELGYVEGRNINFEWRYADAQFSRAMQFAAELVRLPVAVIVAYHTPAVRAAMNATKSIPIVMSPAGAPLELGFINSLARPGGNVTGLSAMEAELGGKRLGLLQEMIPGLTRVAVLAAKTDPFSAPFVKDFQSAGVALNVQVRPALVDGPAEFKAAFANMVDANDQAAIISPTFLPHSAVIVALANLHRIPTISSYRVTTQAGGLLSYSADHAAYYRRAGVYVDKLLKGTKPAELPVEQPTKFELVINLTAAKTLGLTIPTPLLARADEVIE